MAEVWQQQGDEDIAEAAAPRANSTEEASQGVLAVRCRRDLPEFPPVPFPMAETARRSYLVRHWRGELALPVSYWVNTLLATIIVHRAIEGVPWDDFLTWSPKMCVTTRIALWLVLTLTAVWQFVGVWRSATHYLGAGQSKLWGNLAKVIAVLGLMSTVAVCVVVAIPQIIEYAKIASGKDSFGTYQLRVLRDATELELTGPIVFGLTDDVRRTLDAHPTIWVMHLNSEGGRVGEARNLRTLIESRGLTTFTASGCFSACTLAYAAGRERLIAPNARLGFHQYSFPGTTQHALQQEYEKDKQDWLARGFARTFVERAFVTPHNELWRPTHAELFEAGIVTGYPESNDVAVTGYQLHDVEQIEREFAKDPLFAAFKAYEPQVYAWLVSTLRTGLQKGKSKAELRESVSPLVQSLYRQRLPYASDAALRSFTALLLEAMEVLYAANPALCYAYLYDEEQLAGLDVRRYFSDALAHKDLSVAAEIIRSAAGQANQSPHDAQVDSQLDAVFTALAQRYGDDILMLDNPELGKADPAKMCQMTYDLYQTILRLPERESASVLRFMFASAN